MEVYKFKCKNCGSKQYVKKGESTYECVYCGYKEEVFGTESKKIEPEIIEKPKQSYKIKIEDKQKDISNLTVKLVLCIFLGVFGVHKFVEQKWKLGLIYLFTHGLLYIGVIVDICKYASKLIQRTKEVSALKNIEDCENVKN